MNGPAEPWDVQRPVLDVPPRNGTPQPEPITVTRKKKAKKSKTTDGEGSSKKKRTTVDSGFTH